MTRPLSEVLGTLQEGVETFREYERIHRLKLESFILDRTEYHNEAKRKAEANAAMAQKLEGAIEEVRERLEVLRRGIDEIASTNSHSGSCGHCACSQNKRADMARALLAKGEEGR